MFLYTNQNHNEIYTIDNYKQFFVFKGTKWEESNKCHLNKITTLDAIKILQTSKYRIKQPISVIGSHIPNKLEYNIAYDFGKLMADAGIVVLCGGRTGIMEAVCKGVFENGGTSIGILPGIDINDANKYVSIPIPTGIGFSRNAIIATASFCIFAIGGSYGTLSEIAFALQYKKPVITIHAKYEIEGLQIVNNIKEAFNIICDNIFLADKLLK